MVIQEEIKEIFDDEYGQFQHHIRHRFIPDMLKKISTKRIIPSRASKRHRKGLHRKSKSICKMYIQEDM